jgi:tetratricopeptide (TPR) repeat protein
MIQNFFIFAFFYSNYHTIFIDLCSIADEHPFLSSSKSLDSLYQTLSFIQPMFLDLYSECLKKHPHPKIFYERGMIYFHQGEYFEALKDMKEFSKDASDDLLSADFYMQEATTYAQQNLYDESILSLTMALKKDPTNKEAYFERAAAYFELGDFDNSLKDYLASGIKTPSFTDNVHLALGLTSGIVQGSIEGARDLVPSLLSSLQGIGQGLWALASDPVHVSQEFITAIQNCIEYVKTSTPKESLSLLIPELEEFFEKESTLTAKEKGERIGCIIGKYGIEIFACVGAKKGVQLYQNLRRANNMLTLEAMKISKENQRILRLESIKRANIRSEILKKANLRIEWDKQGKHIVGHQNFDSTLFKSIFEHPNPEKLVQKYAGKGIKWNNAIPGTAGYQEIINFEEFIGYAVKETGEKTATTWGKIHYAKNGVHIVPYQPR